MFGLTALAPQLQLFSAQIREELHNHACLPGHDSALPLEEEEGIA